MLEEKKLRRGLKDISKLFDRPENTEELAPPPSEFFVKAVSAFNPEKPEDGFFINSYLASQAASCGRPSSVLTVRTGSGGAPSGTLPMSSAGYGVRHLTLDFETYEAVCSRPLARNASATPLRHLLFLNTDYRRPGIFTKIIPMLDHWVFLVRPSIDGLMAAYRYIKGMRGANPALQYFLIFNNGIRQDAHCAFLFEKISAMLFQRLGIHLVWLGSLYVPENGPVLPMTLEIEHLFLDTAAGPLVPAKIALAQLSSARIDRAHEVAV